MSKTKAQVQADMEIAVLSGTHNIDLTNKFKRFRFTAEEGVFLEFPERELYHPVEQVTYAYNTAIRCIKENKPLYIMTWSDHILNGLRVAVKEMGYDDTIIYQVDENGKEHRTFLTKDGQLTEWVEGVFDTWDKTLLKLLE